LTLFGVVSGAKTIFEIQRKARKTEILDRYKKKRLGFNHLLVKNCTGTHISKRLINILLSLV